VSGGGFHRFFPSPFRPTLTSSSSSSSSTEPPTPTPTHTLFHHLLHPSNNLKRLTWTNYDNTSTFPIHISSVLSSPYSPSSSLEFLELGCFDFGLDVVRGFIVKSPSSSSSSSSSELVEGGEGERGKWGWGVELVNLRSLKLTLDDTTFGILSKWVLPRLRNLSIVSSSSSSSSSPSCFHLGQGDGFSRFFATHGERILQLELGHSSALIEEYYLPTHSHSHPPSPSPSPHSAAAAAAEPHKFPLAQYCPNLLEFICSATDADWNWRTPDWIAPHPSLPTHPTLQLIGVRDLHLRLHPHPHPSHHHNYNHNHGPPHWILSEQICSLLNRELFPSLRFVRDLSVESHLRRTGIDADADADTDTDVDVGGEDVLLRFWWGVLERCKVGGVWFEDWTG